MKLQLKINIDRIIYAFIGKPEPTPCPFSFTGKNNFNFQDPEPDQDNNIETVTWGSGKTVDAEFEFEPENNIIGWTISQDKKTKLKTFDLDDSDWVIIRSWNSDTTKIAKILPDRYRRVKPYILAGTPYNEISVTLDYSKRWVEFYGPRIKEAHKLRTEKNLFPIE